MRSLIVDHYIPAGQWKIRALFFLAGFLACAAIAAASAVVLVSQDIGAPVPEAVQLRQVSGEKMSLRPVEVTRDYFRGLVTASGPGESEIDIPAATFPAARAWDKKRFGVQVSANTDRDVGIMPLYRIDAFSLGLGLEFSTRRLEWPAATFAAQYWFEP